MATRGRPPKRTIPNLGKGSIQHPAAPMPTRHSNRTWVSELHLLAREIDAICNRKLREFKTALGAEWSEEEQMRLIREGKALLKPVAFPYAPLVDQFIYPSKANESVRQLIAVAVEALDGEAIEIKRLFIKGDVIEARDRLNSLANLSLLKGAT
jgi:hypothetical protein